MLLTTAAYAAAKSPSAEAVAKPTLPSHVLNLKHWRLVLPTGPSPTDPTLITQPQLATFTDPPYFHVNSAGNGVIFTTPVAGATFSSPYARTELDEMSGLQRASWSDAGASVNTETLVGATLVVPPVIPKVVIAQIHSPTTGLVEIMVDGALPNPRPAGTYDVVVAYNYDVVTPYLSAHYTLGTKYTVKMFATEGHISVSFDGKKILTLPDSSPSLFFKAGCYPQTNPADGENAKSYARTEIYDLTVSHT